MVAAFLRVAAMSKKPYCFAPSPTARAGAVPAAVTRGNSQFAHGKIVTDRQRSRNLSSDGLTAFGEAEMI
jgi:hypothetical protein